MSVSEDFLKFSASFYSGSLSEHSDVDAWIESRIDLLDKKRKSEVLRFLNRTLSTAMSDKELQAIWLEGGSNYGVGIGEYRQFFGILRDKLSQ